LILLVVAACAGESSPSRVAWSPVAHAPQDACVTGPHLPGPIGFRHTSTRLAAAVGEARHRVNDLVATEGENQTLQGVLGYDALDKEAEDEDVEVCACAHGSWHLLGRTMSDGFLASTLSFEPHACLSFELT
jgi:hypothetical protein